jgi:hypothetical protein
MPFFGIGIHVIVAIFFAIHAVRNNRSLYWLFVLFSFPLLGSIVYFVVEYLPGSRMHSSVNRGMGKATTTAVNLLDPAREVREARSAFDLSPSAQNRMRLAKALLARGETHESIEHFDACLSGPFGKDPEFLYAAATAKLQDGQALPALELAKTLRATVPDYLGERAALLLAEAYAATGDQVSANAEFASAVERFGSIEARARYAIWSAGANNLQRAEKLYDDIASSERHWNSHTRALNRPLLQQVEKAISLGKRSST